MAIMFDEQPFTRKIIVMYIPGYIKEEKKNEKTCLQNRIDSNWDYCG